MASDLILTTAQAQAVYSAMCALDALGPDHGAEFHLGDWVYVRRVHLGGAIRIEDRADGDDERHDDLAAFAAAYGLASGMAFTVAHVDHGAIVVDHVQAKGADEALAQAQQQDLTDPVVFAGHIVAQASA
ncbi:hypothetical protein HGQ98_00570 [Achromobacter ruhlandii]|uniref:Uncharacterized protein n=1 Tax=Achromobacter ruhlandii TaxID=72557 RepID=A0A848NCV2_9BURK|nr:hypothetical protein [Achromobacter ruhlandii]NMU88381.1 hypothetical protein [Achromobacter ruhlandii]